MNAKQKLHQANLAKWTTLFHEQASLRHLWYNNPIRQRKDEMDFTKLTPEQLNRMDKQVLITISGSLQGQLNAISGQLDHGILPYPESQVQTGG